MGAKSIRVSGDTWLSTARSAAGRSALSANQSGSVLMVGFTDDLHLFIKVEILDEGEGFKSISRSMAQVIFHRKSD